MFYLVTSEENLFDNLLLPNLLTVDIVIKFLLGYFALKILQTFRRAGILSVQLIDRPMPLTHKIHLELSQKFIIQQKYKMFLKKTKK